jgi:hypothetical protein
MEAAGGGGAAVKEKVAQSNASLDAIRKACKNTLHMATTVLANPLYQLITRLLVCMCAPLEMEHGLNNQSMRSPEACARYYCDMALGSGMKPLEQIFSLLYDGSSLEYMGVQVHITPGALDVADPSLAEPQQELSERIGGFAISLVAARFKTVIQYTMGLPQMFAVFAGSNIAAQRKVLATVRECFEAYLEACSNPACTTSWWKHALERSVFRMPICRTLVSICIESGWEPCDALSRFSLEVWSSIGQSKVIEDAFQRERRAETHDTENKLMTKSEAWMLPIGRQVLSKVHSFEEVKVRHALAQHDVTKLPLGVFKPSQKKVSMDMSDLTSEKPKAAWPTWSADNLPQQVADTQILVWARLGNRWGSAHLTWHSQLMKEGMVMRRRDRKAWVLSLGPLGGHAFAFWDLEVIQLGGLTCYSPTSRQGLGTSGEQVHVDIATGVDEWVVLPCEWLSPLQAFIRSGVVGPPRLTLCAVGEEVGLLQHAAQHCFWRHTWVFLNLLAASLGLQKGTTLWETLERLIRHALNPEDEELFQIMSMRVVNPESLMKDILETCAAPGALDDDTKKELQDTMLKQPSPIMLSWYVQVAFPAQCSAVCACHCKACGARSLPHSISYARHVACVCMGRALVANCAVHASCMSSLLSIGGCPCPKPEITLCSFPRHALSFPRIGPMLSDRRRPTTSPTRSPWVRYTRGWWQRGGVHRHSRRAGARRSRRLRLMR